jgi:hypothetical protein
MTLSMYQASVTVSQRALKALSTLLTKAEADAEARKIDPSVFTSARLAPDMFALARQVQIAADTARNGAAYLAGVTAPSHPDTETTFPELQARIKAVQDYLAGFTPEQINASEDRTLTIKMGGQEMQFPATDYLLGFVIPNLYFHIGAAYNILRHNGVAVGKRDFLGM